MTTVESRELTVLAISRGPRDRGTRTAVGFGGWLITGVNTEVIALSCSVTASAPGAVAVASGLGSAASAPIVAGMVVTSAAVAGNPSGESVAERVSRRMEAARRTLTTEAVGPLAGVDVVMTLAMVALDGECVFAGTGDNPVYLIADGYGARVDAAPISPGRSWDVGLRAAVLDGREQRRVWMRPTDLILLSSVPLEDLGVVLRWSPSDLHDGGSWLTALLADVTRRIPSTVVTLAAASLGPM